MSECETTTPFSVAQDLTQVHPGDHLEAGSQGVLRHQGIVEDIAPNGDVAWVRETGHGEQTRLVPAGCEGEEWS